MKGTLISILVGALGGTLLTVGANVHASHVAAGRATAISGDNGIAAPIAAEPSPTSEPPAAAPDEQRPPAN